MKKILIAMSGGVDSSVAAYLLQQAGYEVIGGMLKLHSQKDRIDATGCCTTQDVEDAKMVAGKLQIPFHLFDYQADFDHAVIARFIQVYENGGTPNPCVDCNRNIKFPLMLREAERLGCDGIATGHYAQIERDGNTGRYLLKKAADLSKDQSYVLYGLRQEELSRILFPLGGMDKRQVRQIAEEAGFVTAHKSDSQDICFIPDGDYGRFIETYTGQQFQPGAFVNRAGDVLGTHKGLIRYTIGQRKGLGLSLPAPLFVIEKNVAANQVVLGTNEELMRRTLEANEINFIPFSSLAQPLRVQAKVRYKQAAADATVTQIDHSRFHVSFTEPQRAIAKGQAVVLYDGDVVVGGGTIC